AAGGGPACIVVRGAKRANGGDAESAVEPARLCGATSGESGRRGDLSAFRDSRRHSYFAAVCLRHWRSAGLPEAGHPFAPGIVADHRNAYLVGSRPVLVGGLGDGIDAAPAWV